MHCEGMESLLGERHILICVECEILTVRRPSPGWRGYRSDEEEIGEAPELASYCSKCAASEFGAET
jgi:hypothetical protein